ncbi:adenosylcobinamide-GDP ribazoletransferase [Vibrio ziniensis]|uniref:Adenosylcobinamide-GDP ribazoletransferase n=1 Tax=Vibrio ziniensis TaxID=2711221 RepID=A0A6G7CIH7_9VIBR|nr:adenosylcobinamide-GDP ribazoletransferase [Vibrio ziniensis]QIH41853.1 adenosylcobinamide-GDP ribazoletransferase [Vibrio ziniensis]
MKPFLVTLQFITRIPVPQSWTSDYDFDQTYRGVVTFPIVGAILGIIAAAISVTLYMGLGWNSPLSAVTYVFSLALLTGGFHLDGLADTCDGIFSARTPERMLEIMKDSRLGTHGALALFFVLTLKILTVTQILDTEPEEALLILVIAPCISRAWMSLLMYKQNYARESGLGHIYINRISSHQFYLTLAIGAAIASWMLGWQSLIAFCVTGGFALIYRRYINNTIGGQTGDTLGAGNELFELCFLMAMTSVWTLSI